MQDRYHTAAGRQYRPTQTEQDSHSKLEQIKRQVKSWFSDEQDNDYTPRSNHGYGNRDYRFDRDQYPGTGYSAHYDDWPNRSYEADSRGYGNPRVPREDFSTSYPRNYTDVVDLGVSELGNDPLYRPSRGAYYNQRMTRLESRRRGDQNQVDGGYESHSGRQANEHDESQYQYNRAGSAYGNSRTAPYGYNSSEPWMVPGPYVGTGPKGYQRSPDKLQDQVSERLENDGRICASEIEVAVADGEITLKGKVPNRNQKRLAEECAESVWGVKDVHNQLTIDANADYRSNGHGSQVSASATGNGSTLATQTGRKDKS